MGCDISKGCLKEKNSTTQNGSILDRVISQASSQDQCLLYKFANYKKGGELIDAYHSGGQAKVEQLIKDRFGQLMYQSGKGQIINRAEYLRWKFSDCEQVTLPIEASLSHNDPLAKWTDHEACWQMQYRGSLGETLVHVLIICDTKIHTRLARTLIKCFPKLAIDVIEGEEYLGASALHLAIAYDNSELVQDLVEAGANVNQRAIGSFFLPRDQQRAKQAKHTDYEGLAYLGEYPLAWSACCANESVYNLLLDNGANPDYQDTYGNMVLHMVVVCDKLDMFGYALRHPKLPASNGITNSSGLTPLTLACKLGRAEVFREMLELSAKEFWRYSNITCSAYTLNALDTILPDGRTNWNSALFIILNGTKEEHLDMLDGGIIQRLLEEKWKAFARNQFLKRLLILLVHLLLLSSAVYLRPEDPDEPLLQWQDDIQVIARYTCEIGTVLGVLSYVILQQGDEIKNQGFWTFLKHQSNSPAKAIFLVSNLLILACIPYRILGDRETEEAILVFAVPGSWFLLMFFAGAVRLTGPFVTMIYSMITGDMLTFGIIYTIVLFGFSQSFYFLYKGYPNTQNTLYHNYPSTWMALFQITMGNYDYGELGKIAYPKLSKSVFAIFMVFVPILLLNMLIAMMGNTYAHVIEQSEKEWMKQWAKIVVTLERAISQSDAKNYLEEYSISLGPSEDPSTEQRGVMVIKTKSKTRAKQRKGAVANWKRLGKVTINALKKKGLTGEELRCIMWGRESINTPVRNRNPKSTIKGSQVPNITEAFGETVSAALDLTSFAHNIQFRKTDEICETIIRQETPKEKVDGTNGIPDETAASKLLASTLSKTPNEKPNVFHQLTDKITPKKENDNEKEKEQLSPFEFKLAAPMEPYHDPLRELVLNSRSQEAEEKTLNTLAIQAANLSNVNESTPLENNKQNDVNNLINLFSTLPSQPPQTEKTLIELYLNKSHDQIEKPLLGSISRSLRSKSVYCRKMGNKVYSEERPNKFVLNKFENGISKSSQQELDYIERRISQVNGRLKQNEQELVQNGFLIDEHNKQDTIRNISTAPEKIQEFQSERSIDPLEAWSVKEITNMSKLLSCQIDSTNTLDK